ncbi:MAG: AI-2E family transporter [Agathobacter rectalis]
MEVNNKMKHTIKVAWAKWFSQFLALAGAILLVFVLFKFDAIMAQIVRIINILMPIIMGIVLAYLINPMVEFYDRKLSNSLGKAIEKKCGKRPSMRGLSILISLAIIIAIIVVLIMMVVPQLVSNITNAVSLLPDQIQDLVKKITELAKNNDRAKEIITELYNNGISYFTEWVKDNMLGQVTFVINGIMGIFGTAVNCLVAFIVAIYVLLSKDTFKRQTKKLVSAFLPERHIQVLSSILKESDKIFGGFISGKIIDSLIIGAICFVCCLILRMPYVALISVIVGVTNVIPFFGPYIGAIPSTILIMLDSPSKGVIFLLFIIILQQVDGNIIGPKILGESTGLSPFWVVFAIFLGNGLFGVVGLFIGVPTWGVVYYLIKRYVNYRVRKKE